MRLLHTTTGRFHIFDDPWTVRYAILSHVWARENDRFFPEPTLQDVVRIQAEYDADPPETRASIISRLPEKVRRFCETAAAYGFDYAWADPICIDKTSSSELSEAINSMFDWYRTAPAHSAGVGGSTFRRGWTLQELLAPVNLCFFSEWNVIGSKHMFAPLVEQITRIPQDILTLRKPLGTANVACRMSWAVRRETTREEDEAYSLMGIFGVKIPTTYGEDRYAFIRLQEQILKAVPDQSLFA
ncbi:hypothetical protein BN946_scf184855.g4 [Trametes cinnabarina]|uniref:Uncharacterized protein n=1 Tax=Pycnoporus cinnabarinus TaxID=5643 RepID=A0A060SMK2_PYCCI|nr:hypothetical protein BN946_scf184855.g4 [Trametes cinnabarina]